MHLLVGLGTRSMAVSGTTQYPLRDTTEAPKVAEQYRADWHSPFFSIHMSALPGWRRGRGSEVLRLWRTAARRRGANQGSGLEKAGDREIGNPPAPRTRIIRAQLARSLSPSFPRSRRPNHQTPLD